jgi:hypothetical protein
MHNRENERDESDALDETLRITTRIIEAAAPAESYWAGYHARLRQKLNQAHGSHVVATRPSWITKFFHTSVSVPVPVAIALILVVALSLFFFRRTSEPSTPQVQVVHVPIEVPVVQEKVVTRVVYRPMPRKSKPQVSPARDDSTLAKTLVGFKPTEEIKLTVIKGGTANEK